MAAPYFPEIRPDNVDDSSTLLDSFVDLRRKNLESLYGKGNDKSPKGFVDTAIRNLVNLINAHPSFVTLSSCSGRVAVFDPKKATSAPYLEDEQKEDSSRKDDRTAKGRGEWIFVSHEPVEKFSLVELLKEHEKKKNVGVKQDNEKLVFKHEPLLLHVAACSLSRGRQLLNLALQLGFRESGLVVSQTRVTVAIRSHSLALCVPLSYHGSLRPPDDYLVALLEESNQLMSDNMKKLSRLEDEVRTCLFVPTFSDEKDTLEDSLDELYFENLPSLNLWGHDAVVVPEACDGLSIYVFGGYGRGPNPKSSKIERSNRIYAIRRYPEGNFSEKWEEIKVIDVSLCRVNEQKRETTWFGAEYVSTNSSAAEGLQVCLLPMNKLDISKGTYSPVIAIFGGRSDPCTPFGSLLLYEPNNQSDRLIKPIDVRGDIPSPRWGHTLTSLSGKNGILAILIGGRSKEGVVVDNVHILKLIKGDSDSWFFEWQLLQTTIPPQFHHTVSTLGDDTIIIGGGISDPNNLIECFSFGVLAARKQQKGTTTKPKALSIYQIIEDNKVNDIPLSGVEGYIPHYGSSSCCFCDREGKRMISFCGGVTMELDKATRSGDHPIQLFSYNGKLSSHKGKYNKVQDKDVRFESMIHHCCLALPNTLGFLVLGGGVSSFAFGASFAESFRATFSTNNLIVSEASRLRERHSLETLPNLATTKMKVENTSQENCEPVNVVFVEKQNAKALRVALSADNLLNKNYRMIRADENAPLDDCENYIAVPINNGGYKLLRSIDKPSWSCMIVAEGQQEMPLSTAVMGRQKSKKSVNMKL